MIDPAHEEVASPPEDVRRRQDLVNTAVPLIPYENYVGALLGGQFRLGALIRQDADSDVYSVYPLDQPAETLEAKAYILSGIPNWQLEKRKKSMNKLKGRRICSIDQAGRKFIVYRIDERPWKTLESQEDLMSYVPCKPLKLAHSLRNAVGTSAAVEPCRHLPKPINTRATEQAKLDHRVGGHKAAIIPSWIRPEIGRRTFSTVVDSSKNPQVTGTTILGKEQSSQGTNIGRKRNRGLRKIKIPHFDTFAELDSFCTKMTSRLVDLRVAAHLKTEELYEEEQLYRKQMIRSSRSTAHFSIINPSSERILAQHRQDLKILGARAKRLGKTALIAWNQHKSFSSYCTSARQRWEIWESLREHLIERLSRSKQLELVEDPLPWLELRFLTDISSRYEKFGWSELERHHQMEIRELWRAINNGQERIITWSLI